MRHARPHARALFRAQSTFSNKPGVPVSVVPALMPARTGLPSPGLETRVSHLRQQALRGTIRSGSKERVLGRLPVDTFGQRITLSQTWPAPLVLYEHGRHGFFDG